MPVAEPPIWLRQGNDYRGVLDLAEAGPGSASVVIPVFNRVNLLANVLAGLVEQETSTPFDVIVVDDGSDEDVEAATGAVDGSLRLRHLRQERSGRGAGRARNLGASTSDADVLVFLDADCIPDPRYIESHMVYHRRASNVVVTASRRHLDRPVEPGDVIGFSGLLAEAGVPAEDQDDESIPPDDWRRLFFRRTQSMLLGDAAFRGVAGGLMSVRRERFHDVGGFDESFNRWGGEDTELGWRLWNDGCFVVPEMGAVVIHQRSDDPMGIEGRSRERRATLSLVADRVPHRFYRTEPSHLYRVPKVSVVVAVDRASDADRAWREVTRASFTDTELILVGFGPAVETRAVLDPAGRVSAAADVASAIQRARGECILLIDGGTRFDRRLFARVMKRFDDPRVSAVRVGYKTGKQRLVRLIDLERVDRSSARLEIPFFLAIKRRELVNHLAGAGDVADAIIEAVSAGRTELLITDLVELPEGVSVSGSRIPGLSEVRAAGPKELARGARKAFRPAPSGSAEVTPTAGSDTGPSISYVGLAGHDNLGDDAMLAAIRQLMPWATVDPDRQDADVVMLGGGTLLNADGYYLNKVRRVDGPDAERIVFGTGVRNPGFWGVTERIDDWRPFLESSLSVGVRGPDSLAALREWGYAGEVDILGDPALALDRPMVESRDGLVVLCPLHTGGSCWGGDDEAVLARFAQLASHFTQEGRPVALLTAHPHDDRWAIEVMRMAGLPDLEYLPGYHDVGVTLDLIASADVMVGERLHAIVLAAAMGTRFVGVEYRPKVRDFAKSINADAWVVRTDAIESLRDIVEARLETDVEFVPAVEDLRRRQLARADHLGEELGVGTTAPTRAGD